MVTQTAAVANGKTENANDDDSKTDYVCFISDAHDSKHTTKNLVWHIDSGASNHMTFNRSAFVTYENIIPFGVHLGDKTTATAVGRCTVQMKVLKQGQVAICRIIDVLHVPSLAFSLVSVNQLAKRGLHTSFRRNFVQIKNGSKVLATGSRRASLYVLDASSDPPLEVNSSTACVASLQLWHERMGHVHIAGLRQMAHRKIVKGIDIAPLKHPLPICEGCVMGKMVRKMIPKKSENLATGILDLVHSDIASRSQSLQ